jgi:hypothetical protein
MERNIKSMKAFVDKHRGKLAAGITATAFLLLLHRNAKQLEIFMADHNLLTEYHEWLTSEK